MVCGLKPTRIKFQIGKMIMKVFSLCLWNFGIQNILLLPFATTMKVGRHLVFQVIIQFIPQILKLKNGLLSITLFNKMLLLNANNSQPDCGHLKLVLLKSGIQKHTILTSITTINTLNKLQLIQVMLLVLLVTEVKSLCWTIWLQEHTTSLFGISETNPMLDTESGLWNHLLLKNKLFLNRELTHIRTDHCIKQLFEKLLLISKLKII